MEYSLVFQVKNQKDQGSYEDFLECLKLYDKAENGTMLGAELEHSLKALGESQRRQSPPDGDLIQSCPLPGEKLSDDEVAELFADCMDPEDEDGNVFYARECYLGSPVT